MLANPKLTKFISRKLIVFGVATGLLMHGSLTENSWVLIACAYLGAQAITGIRNATQGSDQAV